MTTSVPPGPILIFSGVRGDTRRYRTLHLYEQMCLAGADCRLSHLTDPRLPELAGTASAAVLHRVPMDGYVEQLFRVLRQRNALVVLDADDFLYDPAIMRWIDSPDFQDPVRASLYRQEILRHRATLEMCDAVTVSTRYLAEMMAPFGKPVFVHRNAFNLELLAISNQAMQSAARRADRLVMGYASGTRTHDRDFSLIRPVLQDLLEHYPQLELWLMGAVDPGLEWGAAGERVRVFPLVPWRMLPERLAMLDINLAPLVSDSPFNQAKSEIKFMEAALVRVPTVASQTDAFAFAIESGRNGFLADDAEKWRSSLEFLIQNPEARQAIGEAAYQDVLAGYAPWERGKDILQLLSDLAEHSGKTALPTFKAPFAVSNPLDETLLSRRYFTLAEEEHPTMTELARYSIRHRGLCTLLGQVWVYFRRKLAPIIPFRSTISV